jgi:hypothetical protein
MTACDAVDGSHPPASQCAKSGFLLRARQWPLMANSGLNHRTGMTTALGWKAEEANS